MGNNSYDNLEAIDKENIFDVIDSQPNQLRQNYADTMREDITKKDGVGIKNIVFVGMGGSAFAGSIAKNWLSARIKIPFYLVRGDSLPAFVDKKSLVIISSYSGNTEETMQVFINAIRLKARVIVLLGGGKLLELAKKAGVTVLQLPKTTQPRLSVFAGLKALSCVMQDTGLLGDMDLREELINTANFLDSQKLLWGTDKIGDNQAKIIAQKLQSKPVIIDTSPMLESAGLKWKISINENAKQLAFRNTFTELNHNEMQGWVFPYNKDFGVVVLKSSFEPHRIEKRIKITEEILHKYGYRPYTVTAQGTNHIQQLLSIILLGDYVSAYLGILNGVDPTPVEMVEEFKKRLALEA